MKKTLDILAIIPYHPTMIPRIETSETLTIYLDGRSHVVYKTDAKYQTVSNAVESNDVAGLRMALGTATALAAYTNGAVKIIDGEVTYDGKSVHNVVTEKIMALLRAGKKYDYMLNFLGRVRANPLPSAVEELYLFLEKAQIPITPDGSFLAYRKVDKNYLSYHANLDGTKNSNKVGETVEMDRAAVNTNRHNTCSTGLHFCSFSYLSSYQGGEGRVMIVKIDPADVVSIPSDYNNSKGRCCKYVVVAEHEKREEQEAFKDVVLANPDGTAHTGRDIDIQQNAFAAQTQPKNALKKRIVGYIREKLDSNKKPTLRQIQSSVSPRVPTILSLSKLVVKYGFKFKPAKKGGLGASFVSE